MLLPPGSPPALVDAASLVSRLLAGAPAFPGSDVVRLAALYRAPASLQQQESAAEAEGARLPLLPIRQPALIRLLIAGACHMPLACLWLSATRPILAADPPARTQPPAHGRCCVHACVPSLLAPWHTRGVRHCSLCCLLPRVNVPALCKWRLTYTGGMAWVLPDRMRVQRVMRMCPQCLLERAMHLQCLLARVVRLCSQCLLARVCLRVLCVCARNACSRVL